MTAMAEMVADMMLKALPNEVRLLLTPENLTNIQQKIVIKWSAVEGALTTILAGNAAIMETLTINETAIAEALVRLERIENAARGSTPSVRPSRGGPRKPRALTATNGSGH